MMHVGIAAATVFNRLESVIRSTTVVVAIRDSRRGHRSWLVAMSLVAIVALGIGLRLAILVADRSLWIDEAMLALNLVERCPQQLLGPLDYNQGAPVGFLLAVKSSIVLLGVSEWTLRLVPFLGSVAGLVIFVGLARRLLPEAAGLLAVGLLAVSPHLVSYAGECKQYATDAAIASGLLACALGLLKGQGGSVRWCVLALAGAAAVWCSHPAAFVLGGIGTALLVHAIGRRNFRRCAAGLLVIAGWLVSFGAGYVVCLKSLSGNKYLTEYWGGYFLTLPPKSVGDLAWVIDQVVTFFTLPGGFGGSVVPVGGFAAVLAFIGLRELAREQWPVAAALALPAVFVLLASGLHKYPAGGRLLLFLVPLAVLLVARGAWAVFATVREQNRFAAVALLGLLVVGPMWATADTIRRPPRHEQLAPVLDQVEAAFQPGDRLYVYYGARPAFVFYTRQKAFPEGAVTFGAEHRRTPTGYRAELGQLRGRVWVVISHRHGDEEAVIRTILEGRGHCEHAVHAPGAAAYLYRLD